MSAITPAQLHLLHHTLGVTPERRTPYRNHFVAGDGHHDMPDLLALEAAGLMKRSSTPKFCEQGDIVFTCTPAGQDHAALNLPMPPKRSRYWEFRDSDCGNSFAEWLGIEVPRRKYNDCVWRCDPKYNWVRFESSKATGEYCKTLKEAKASYKAALTSARAQQKERAIS